MIEETKKEDKESKSLWNIHAVANYLGVSYRTIAKWITYKYIPSVKIGRHRRFLKEDIDSWLKTKTNESNGDIIK